MIKSSMFYWWPLVKDCGVPMPRTIMVPWVGEYSWAPIEGKPHEPFDNMVEEVKKAAAFIGYPVFVRSDHLSGKHDWKETCYVEEPEQMRDHLARILEASAMASVVGLPYNGTAVREFLELDWKFTAFWSEMPVAKEFRFFVRDGKIECWHPYWPPMSIKKPSVENWQQLLKEINRMEDEDLVKLTKYARLIGETIDGFWSVDFCKTKKGEWYMTDMGEGEKSYHWPTCPNAPPEMMERYGDPEEVGEDPYKKWRRLEEEK